MRTEAIAPIKLSFTLASAIAVRCPARPARHEALLHLGGTDEYRRAFSQAWDQPLEHIVGAESCAWCDLYSLSPDVAQLHPSLHWCALSTQTPSTQALRHPGFSPLLRAHLGPALMFRRFFFGSHELRRFHSVFTVSWVRPRSLRRGSKPRSVLSFFPIERQDAGGWQLCVVSPRQSKPQQLLWSFSSTTWRCCAEVRSDQAVEFAELLVEVAVASWSRQ